MYIIKMSFMYWLRQRHGILVITLNLVEPFLLKRIHLWVYINWVTTFIV